MNHISVKKIRKQERELSEAYAAVMVSDAGRKVLSHILMMGHINSSSGNPDSQHVNDILEGERRLACRIQAELMNHPRVYLQMLEKNLSEAEIINHQEKDDAETDV